MTRKLALIGLLMTLIVLLWGAYLRILPLEQTCPFFLNCETGDNGAKTLDIEHVRALGRTVYFYLVGALCVVTFLLVISGVRRGQNLYGGQVLAGSAVMVMGLQLSLAVLSGHQSLLPWVITAHLGLGCLMMLILQRFYLIAGGGYGPVHALNGLKRLAGLSLVLVLLETILGGWVSSNYAGLACLDFPKCQGTWGLNADYLSAFFDLSDLDDPQGRLLPVPARMAIQMVHRIGALGVFVLLSVLAFRVTSNPLVPKLSKQGLLLNVLLLLEIGVGIALIKLRLPVHLVVLHALLSALILLTVGSIYYALSLPSQSLGPSVGQSTPRVLEPQEASIPPDTSRLFDRLRLQLGKTRVGFTGLLSGLTTARNALDRELLDDLEAQMLMADMGAPVAQGIVRHLADTLGRDELLDAEALRASLRGHLLTALEPVDLPLLIAKDKKPFVILVVGVNGVGKTTTIGKLAKKLQNQGLSIMLAAGDTFRAAAVEQLQTWGERNQVPVIAQHTGADSASVIFDAVQSAQSKGIDVLIADTAGRLHTKSNLMDELSKIKRIMGRLDDSAPHEVLLVLDAGTGQNAINQAKQFNEAVGLTGLVLTKLDGTAKGGVIFALAKQLSIPVRFIGIGEGIDDLQAFNAEQFVDALLSDG